MIHISLTHYRHLLAVAAFAGSLLIGFAPRSAHAIIVMGGRDASGIFNNSGTNYNPAPDNLYLNVGRVSGLGLGTAIAPQYFICAAHGRSLHEGFFTAESNYSVGYNATLAGTVDDIAIYKLDGNARFDHYAPLYTRGDEAGQKLITMGQGTTRGAAIFNQYGDLAGWQYGSSQTTSWGRNTVDEVANVSPGYDPNGHGGEFLYFQFNRQADANGNLLVTDEAEDEGIFSGGDSGGGTFVLDTTDNAYKLAGINSFVENGVYDKSGHEVIGALFDVRGFYYYSPKTFQLTEYTGDQPIVAGSYASRISSHYDYIARTAGLAAVPEPSLIASFALAGIGGMGLLARRRRAKR